MRFFQKNGSLLAALGSMDQIFLISRYYSWLAEY